MGNYLTSKNRVYGLRTDFTEGDFSWYQPTPQEKDKGANSEFNAKDKAINAKLLKFLTEEDSETALVSSTPKIFSAIAKQDFNEDFYIHEDELDAYCEGFASTIYNNIDQIWTDYNEKDTSKNDLIESAMDDEDVKLSLYRSFKSLYDKWISNSKTKGGNTTSGYFYNNYAADYEAQDSRTLFEHFRFINRANEDIGGKAVIDISYLSNLSDTSSGQGPTQSLYNSLTNLLSKNNFDFWPLPSDTPLYLTSTKEEDLKDMFRPNDFLEDTKPGPMFNCVFIGGSSRTVADLSNDGKFSCKKIDINNYKDDSFDIGDPTQTDTPKEFLNPDKGVVAFKVRYGQEAQNHFQTLDIDQTNHKETQESLQVIDALTNPKTGSQPSQIGKGNSMYDVYLTRSYNCSVKGLGNMSIQPLMYFTLENVPMFRGTYLITGVKHDITAHNSNTTFTGMRQPKITVPLVTDALSLLDLALTPDEAFEGKRTDLNNYNNPSVNYSNNPNELVPGGKCTASKSRKGCKQCLGSEYTTYVNGFDTPNAFSGQEIKPVKKSSKVSINSSVKDKILPIINSSSYKSSYTKGHRMFALVWAQKEGFKPGSRSYRTNNPGNIGNTDSGKNREISTLQEGMDLLMDFIKKASEGNTKYGKGWSFGEKEISPNWSNEIANNPQTYKRVNGCLPGYKGNYQGQLGFFTKRYATFSRVSNGSLGRLITIFELNGKTGLNGNTTLKELLDFNNNTEMKLS